MLNGQNFVAGEWRDGADWVEDVNPSDVTDIVGRFAQARPSDIHDAVAAAQGAQRQWAAAGLEARSAVLDAIGRELMARSKELGELLSREEGKTLPEGVGEVYRAGQFFTYFAADVAYLKDKVDRGFVDLIYVLGADHGGYVKRLEALARAVAGDRVKLTVLLCQLVKLYRDGEPVRMSKRSGDFITLREVVEEVGRDPIRFMMLYRKSDAPLDFDFAKVTEQSKDNPVFYVQYASARCHSVFRQAAEQFPGESFAREKLAAGLGALTDEGEIGLIRKLAEYPRLIEQAALSLEPHRLAFYLFDLASTFHAAWNRGTENPDLRFVKVNDPQLTQARLGLVQG